MKELALRYYEEGYNCSQCILKAAEVCFEINVPDPCYSMCSAVGNGFGIGEFCCILVAGTMVFGLLFDEKTAKRLRIKFLYEFSLRHEKMNCCQLKKENIENSDCTELIMDTADIVYRIVKEEIN